MVSESTVALLPSLSVSQEMLWSAATQIAPHRHTLCPSLSAIAYSTHRCPIHNDYRTGDGDGDGEENGSGNGDIDRDQDGDGDGNPLCAQ